MRKIYPLLLAALFPPAAMSQIAAMPDGDGVAVMNGDRRVLTIRCGEITGAIDSGTHTGSYSMPTGKRRECSYEYAETRYVTATGDTLTMRVYTDGVAWAGAHDYVVDIADATHSWLMDWTESYEGFYEKDRTDITPGRRISYPALFEYGDGDLFMLLSESGVDSTSAGSSMYATDTPGSFQLAPDGAEMPGWQTAIIGTLAEVVESTLVADNSLPSRLDDVEWVRPGMAAWVYWAYNHGSNDLNIIKRYVDLAHSLKLPYVLIDAEWDEMKDGHTVTEALEYARSQGVMPMIWYNSSVGWVEGAPGPKWRLNDPADREREFAWCEANGIRGVKIDFFSGDTNRNLSYMVELLESAARHGLAVNFHGATIPRGLQRTYPNLVSVEGVYGAEWYNNVPTFTARAARHNATLPFTRNVVGSMDYTPCAFTDSQHPHITTDAHELALTVLYESGIQHLADRPESFLAQPAEIQSLLSTLPAAWDDTRLLGGYPGEYAVIARRRGDTWWVAGINGSDTPRVIQLDLTSLLPPASPARLTLIADGENGWDISSPAEAPRELPLRPRGGFVMKLQTTL